MNCEHCQELLHARERAGLTPELQAQVVAHVQTCVACAQADAALCELDRLLDAEVTPSPALRAQVLARLAQEMAPRKSATFASMFATLWPSRPLGAFSYSVALLLVGMFSGQLLPGGGADVADIPAERLYQLCAVPDTPPVDIL